MYTNLQLFTNFSKLTSDEKFIFLMSYNNGDTNYFKHVSKFVNICIEKSGYAIDTPIVRPVCD